METFINNDEKTTGESQPPQPDAEDSEMEEDPAFEFLVPLARPGHAAHCKRSLTGLPESQTELDGSRLAFSFYCIGALDLLGLLEEKTSKSDRDTWVEWIWEHQTNGRHGSGFRPSPFMTSQHVQNVHEDYTDYDTPHVIMTYTALLSLAILRDDFTRLNREGLIDLLRSCQREDGSFSTVPNDGDSDLRTVYCAFAISSMLNDWSGVNVERAIQFIKSCRSYEGGYGQSRFCESHGGTTYCALAALYLAPAVHASSAVLTASEHHQTIRWLLNNQDQESGGFSGRTNKESDACYCFWCGGSLQILGAQDLIDPVALVGFFGNCQFKYGGISKAPGEHSDPYHTYLSLAAVSALPESALRPTSRFSKRSGAESEKLSSWRFAPFDPLLNAREETSAWARRWIPNPAKVSSGN